MIENRFLLLGLLLASPAWADGDARSFDISEAKAGKHGILIHDARSRYQAGTTRIRVLLPEHRLAHTRYPVIYLLPVEARGEHKYGDGLVEAERLDLPNTLQCIFVSPSFSHLPWYADHPEKRIVRQESYLLKTVIPFIEKTYPVKRGREGRLLLGFSKSGWGAWSLLLRHPDLFDKAAAWDAPMMMDAPGQYGSGNIFGTPENFEEYRITTLLDRKAAELGGSPRLILLGYGGFRDQHQEVHDLMLNLKIPHRYKDGPERPHTWEGGWLQEAAESLRTETTDSKPTTPPLPPSDATGPSASPAK